MKHTDVRAMLESIYGHMLDADLDNQDWEARQFIAVHMRQFHRSVPTETPEPTQIQSEEVKEDGFQLT